MGKSLRGGKKVNENNLNEEGKKQYEKLKGMAEKYKGKSEKEILSELTETVNKGKANGSISDEKINSIASAIAPMLNSEQRKKLDVLLGSLRR